jgi:hypothetical protein
MIRFACTCGERLEVPQDQAGNSIQCPACGFLVDVPTLSELKTFTEEGTYHVDTTPAPPTDSGRLEELGLIYSRDKFDEEGNEIDLRTIPAGNNTLSEEDIVEDTGELDLKPREDEIIARPKYDPETGELIRPLDIQPDAERDTPPSAIPVAKAALNYAGGDMAKRISPLKVAAELLMPTNVAVMFFIFIAHAFVAAIYIAAWILFFLWPAIMIVCGLIIAHYGNVIDDTARNEQDTLPRPLRDMDTYDDMWSPFLAMAGGFMMSVGLPVLFCMSFAKKTGLPTLPLIALGAFAGSLVAPAILLTTNTSGSFNNLRPDRVLGVIARCGVHYFIVVGLFLVTWPIYLYSVFAFCMVAIDTFLGSASNIERELSNMGMPDVLAAATVSWIFVVPTLLVGIYLMHYFCWYLGVLYKAHHTEFPWVLQRHIRDPRDRKTTTHASKLGRKRTVSGHLIPPSPPPPPPGASHLNVSGR